MALISDQNRIAPVFTSRIDEENRYTAEYASHAYGSNDNAVWGHYIGEPWRGMTGGEYSDWKEDQIRILMQDVRFVDRTVALGPQSRIGDVRTIRATVDNIHLQRLPRSLNVQEQGTPVMTTDDIRQRAYHSIRRCLEEEVRLHYGMFNPSDPRYVTTVSRGYVTRRAVDPALVEGTIWSTNPTAYPEVFPIGTTVTSSTTSSTGTFTLPPSTATFPVGQTITMSIGTQSTGTTPTSLPSSGAGTMYKFSSDGWKIKDLMVDWGSELDKYIDGGKYSIPELVKEKKKDPPAPKQLKLF